MGRENLQYGCIVEEMQNIEKKEGSFKFRYNIFKKLLT
jgi:hypothetical protein